MRVPTVKLRRKSDKKVFIVNEADYASGKIPGMNIKLDGFERIGEERGEDNPADAKVAEQAAANTAKAAEAIAAKPKVAEKK